jgi:hypothetical protein
MSVPHIRAHRQHRKRLFRLQGYLMARSLTVKHEEKPATSLIMTAFLVLAVVWMTASAVFASPVPDAGLNLQNIDAK